MLLLIEDICGSALQDFELLQQVLQSLLHTIRTQLEPLQRGDATGSIAEEVMAAVGAAITALTIGSEDMDAISLVTLDGYRCVCTFCMSEWKCAPSLSRAKCSPFTRQPVVYCRLLSMLSRSREALSGWKLPSADAVRGAQAVSRWRKRTAVPSRSSVSLSLRKIA